MSKKNEGHIKYLKSVWNSPSAHVAFKKFYQTPGYLEQLAHPDTLPFVKELAKKEYANPEASAVAIKIYNKCKFIVHNNHLSSLKKVERDLPANQAGLSSSAASITDSISLKRGTELISIASNLCYPRAKQLEKSNGMLYKKESTHVHISRNHEIKTPVSEQNASKFPINNHKNNFFCAIPSDSTKLSYDQLNKPHNFKTNVPVNSNDLNKKNGSKVKEKSKENLTRILHSSTEDVHGFSYEDHFSSSQSYSVADQAINGSQQHNSISKESSLLHFKNHFSGPESNKIPIEKPLVKQHCLNSHITNVLKFPKVRTPGKSSQYSPSKRSVTSQRQSMSRPDYSSTTSEFSNDDRPDESKNLAIDTSDNSEVAESNPDPKQKSPLSVEMQEGMFVAKKIGSRHEMLVVSELKDFGSRLLEEGGFSWGWKITREPLVNGKSRSIEKVSPLSKSSKEKPGASRGINKCKNNVEPRKSSSDLNRCKQDVEIKQHDVASEDSKGTSYSLSSSHSKKRSADVLSPDGHGRNPNDQKYSKVIDNTMMDFITSKKDRRAIYSGRKTVHEIPKLKDLCTEFLKKNILSIKIPKRVNFLLLEPILDVCSPSKLFKVEEQNRDLSKLTSSLWEKHCRGDFKDQKPVEGETWKELYWKAHSKRNNKLKSLTASISNGIAKAPAERQAKWLNADCKDPERRIKKAKLEEPLKPEQNHSRGSGGSSSKSSGSESSNSPKFILKTPKITKPVKKHNWENETVAPLMSKTKKMLNLVNRRR